MANNFYTEKPPVYEARQTNPDDPDSPYVVVNTHNNEDVRYISKDAFKDRFVKSRTKADPVEDFEPDPDNVDQNNGAGADPAGS